MFAAQYLFGGDVVYSPWFARGGDKLIGTFEVLAIGGASADVEVRLLTKAEDDVGDGTLVTGALSMSIVKRQEIEWNGLNQLVRYRFTPKDVTDAYVLFRTLDPVWFDAVKA